MDFTTISFCHVIIKTEIIPNPASEQSIMSCHTKKGPYGFPICGSPNVHAQSPFWATDMCILSEASSVSTTCLQTAKVLVKLPLCVGLSEPLLVTYVISTLFSCAGSYIASISSITKTYLYNFDPLKNPLSCSKTGIYRGIHYFYLFLLKNIDCGYSLEPPH